MKLFSVLLMQFLSSVHARGSYETYEESDIIDEDVHERLKCIPLNSKKQSIVTMPSGKKYKMQSPDISDTESCDEPDLAILDPSMKEYEVIEREVRSHSGVNTTFKIEKVINSCLWEYYSFYRDKIDRQTGEGDANENYLFAFGSDNKIADIATKGYDERLSRDYPGEPSGLYFLDKSEQTKMKGKWFIFLNRVALGKVYNLDGPKSMTYPPMGFHSISYFTANSSQKQYVVSRGEQAYPEYRIHFEIFPTNPQPTTEIPSITTSTTPSTTTSPTQSTITSIIQKNSQTTQITPKSIRRLKTRRSKKIVKVVRKPKKAPKSTSASTTQSTTTPTIHLPIRRIKSQRRNKIIKIKGKPKTPLKEKIENLL